MKPITIRITIIGLVTILSLSVIILTQKRTKAISEPEKIEIEAWIEQQNLNKYGDPKNRMYLGGTPLFNEGTGESIDRYEYILKNHPDRPWLKTN